MKCVVCNSDEIELKNVKEEIEIENDIVFVPVNVSVCCHCGERYYDKKTMLFLEEIEKKLQKEHSGLQEVGRVLLYSA